MHTLLSILVLVLHVAAGERINDALITARQAYADRGETTTILIAPGDYEEELTIDIPGITLKNAAGSNNESIRVKKGGVGIGEKAVRISWYYGHGYQYASMGEQINYGGKRTRRWNASVLVDAPDFSAEGIIFQNSYNLYVSPAEAADSLVDLYDAPLNWTDKERPKRPMPQRPKQAYSTEVQEKRFGERASAISFTQNAKRCHLRHCRVVGKQDAFYGDHGASIAADSCILQGGVDYIFGGMDLTVTQSELVAQITNDSKDQCYIAAGRAAIRNRIPEELRDSVPNDEWSVGNTGLLFANCHIRHANADEIMNPGNTPIYLCRPWRWWGAHTFIHVNAEAGVLDPKKVSLGLTKGHPAPCVRIMR